MRDLATRIHDECTTQAGMCNHQAVLTVNGHSIGSAGAKEGPENPHLADGTIGQQGAAPNRIASGDRNKQEPSRCIQRNPVGTWGIGQNLIQLAVASQPARVNLR